MSNKINDYDYIFLLSPHKYLLEYVHKLHPNFIYVKEINVIDTFNDGIREVEYKYKGGRDNITTQTGKFVLSDDIIKECVLAYGEKQKTQYAFDNIAAFKETITQAQKSLDYEIENMTAATILLDLDKFRMCAEDFRRNKKGIILDTLLSMKFAGKIYYSKSHAAIYINHKNSIEVDCIINYDHPSYKAAAKGDLFTLLNSYIDSFDIEPREDLNLSYNLYEIDFNDLKEFARYLPGTFQ